MGLHGDPPQAQIWYIAQAAITQLTRQKRLQAIQMATVQIAIIRGQEAKNEAQV